MTRINAREDKLNAGNRSVVNKFESELARDVGSLCNMVAASLSQQNEQLQCIEKFCHTFININDQYFIDCQASSTRFEALKNVVRLHKASANGSLEDTSVLASSNACCVEELLAKEATEGHAIFDDLYGSLSTQEGEIALFARERRKLLCMHGFRVSVLSSLDKVVGVDFVHIVALGGMDKEMTVYVKTIDPKHLVEIGLEGFYGPSTPNK
ncbi:Glycoside hydrolase, catalytic domain-containing protein, partial [Cynara cardunculus var. scolymus]